MLQFEYNHLKGYIKVATKNGIHHYISKLKTKFQEERGDEQEHATWKHRLESVTKGHPNSNSAQHVNKHGLLIHILFASYFQSQNRAGGPARQCHWMAARGPRELDIADAQREYNVPYYTLRSRFLKLHKPAIRSQEKEKQQTLTCNEEQVLVTSSLHQISLAKWWYSTGTANVLLSDVVWQLIRRREVSVSGSRNGIANRWRRKFRGKFAGWEGFCCCGSAMLSHFKHWTVIWSTKCHNAEPCPQMWRECKMLYASGQSNKSIQSLIIEHTELASTLRW